MFHLRERGGEVHYLMNVGTMEKPNIVEHHTPLSAAVWACGHNEPKQEALAGHPEFCIHSGEFFFEGTWDRPKRKRKKDVVCE